MALCAVVLHYIHVFMTLLVIRCKNCVCGKSNLHIHTCTPFVHAIVNGCDKGISIAAHILITLHVCVLPGKCVLLGSP